MRNSRLQLLNLLGVLALAGLCLVQWQRDRRLHLEVRASEKRGLDLEGRLAEQEKVARGVTADLEHFRERFRLAHTEAREAERAAQKLEQENRALLGEREQWLAAVTNWSRAIAERDQRIGAAAGRIRELAAQLNTTVWKFNDLATNHQVAVRRFNDLATNYNRVVGELNECRAAAGKPTAER